MPKMGESVMEGTIIKWHKKVGDKVEKDEIIFEISTDKVDTEIPSPEDGTLAEILHNENETVEVGEVVARISAGGGVIKKKEEKKKYEPKPDKKEEEKDAKVEEQKSKIEPGQKKESKDSNKFYSPLVMNIAEKEGVSFEELESIEGTGMGGRVSKKDILDYLESGRKGKKTEKEVKSKETVESKKAAPVTKSEGTEIIPMDNVRKRIMYHMVNSRDTSVHVTTVIEVDVTKIYKFIKENKEAYMEKEGLRLTYMPFISHAAIKALKEFPYLNASIEGDNIVVKRYINLGIAVAVEPNGLIVPNIRNADEKNLRGLTKSLMKIGNKARNKKLAPDDIMDGTFTITNYGIFGSLFGTPIINQPEVAILGVGAVTKKPVVVEVDGVDTIAVKPMLYLSLAHDHRLVDGMLGGKFLKKIKDDLESFDISIF